MENYVGPYWSDGKLQSSVEFGDAPPLSTLDAESRLHDSAYAHYEDLQHRMAADAIYEHNVEILGGFAKFAGEAVLYGNQTLRAGSNLLEYSKYGPLGLVVGSLINDYYLNDYLLNSERYKKEVLGYYATDPGWSKQLKGTPDADDTNVGVHRRFRGAEPYHPDDQADGGSNVHTEDGGSSTGAVVEHQQSTVFDPYGSNNRSSRYFPRMYRKRRRGGRRRKIEINYE